MTCVILMIRPAFGSKTRVAFFLDGPHTLSSLAGAVSPKYCAPRVGEFCEFLRVRPHTRLNDTIASQAVQKSDVVVIGIDRLAQAVKEGIDLDILLRSCKSCRLKYRVLYWREALDSVPMHWQRRFDLSMGIHFDSSIVNPAFFLGEVRGAELDKFLSTVSAEGSNQRLLKPFTERSGFAIFITSSCNRHPRTEFIAAMRHLIDLDEYGECAPSNATTHFRLPKPYERCNEHGAPKKIPEYSIRRQMLQLQTVSHYKFFFAIENHVADGYVTEKLLQNPLFGGAVPVRLSQSAVVNYPIHRCRFTLVLRISIDCQA